MLTPWSRDGGRDVIVTVTLPGIRQIRIIDQVKRYDLNHKVTAKEVRELAGVLWNDNAVSKGIITGTSDFAPGVWREFETAIPSKLELKNGTQLRLWLLALQNSTS